MSVFVKGDKVRNLEEFYATGDGRNFIPVGATGEVTYVGGELVDVQWDHFTAETPDWCQYSKFLEVVK